jgi:hypothetical protein
MRPEPVCLFVLIFAPFLEVAEPESEELSFQSSNSSDLMDEFVHQAKWGVAPGVPLLKRQLKPLLSYTVQTNGYDRSGVYRCDRLVSVRSEPDSYRDEHHIRPEESASDFGPWDE